MKGQNIQVFARCRPLTGQEKTSVVEVYPESNEVRVIGNDQRAPTESRSFHFDRVFDHDAKQIDVYNSIVGPLIDQALLGFNCTVFAYGQTGTGKTYTMEGDRSDNKLSWMDDPHSGIIPRAISQLFDTLKDNDNEFTVRVSFLELYNEETYDLLSSICDTTRLKIFDDAQKKGSVIVSGLEEIIVQSKDEIYDILKRGSAKRQTAATLLNACSSRSHTIFSVTVHIREASIEGEELLKIGKLNLVDLAGSENIGRSGALDKRAREAGNINQSLLTLGRVITALVEKRPHIPYRESKLTRLLQDSLGGRTKTSIIATVSPAPLDLEDTISTLEYASRAKKITNKPEMNQRLTKKALLKEYTQEIERLRRDLQATQEKNGIYIDPGNYEEMCKQLSSGNAAVQEKEERLKALQEENEKNQRLFLEFTHNYEQTKKELDKAQQRCEKQRRVIKTQIENEKKLAKQAADLIHVAEIASQDNLLLHGKKERIESILRENRASIDRYQPEVRGDITRSESLVEMFSNQLNGLIKTFHDKLDEEINQNYTVFEQARSKNQVQAEKLISQSRTLRESISNLRKQVKHYETLEAECKSQLKNLNKELGDRLELADGLDKLAEDLKAGDPIPETLSNTLDRFKSNSKENAEKFQQITATLNSSVKREFGSLRQKIERFFTREIKEDVHTGFTPQKKSYEIPKRLDRTSLSESILEDVEDPHLETSITE